MDTKENEKLLSFSAALHQNLVKWLRDGVTTSVMFHLQHTDHVLECTGVKKGGGKVWCNDVKVKRQSKLVI